MLAFGSAPSVRSRLEDPPPETFAPRRARASCARPGRRRSSTPGPLFVLTADLIVLISSCFGQDHVGGVGIAERSSLLPPIRPKLLFVAITHASSGGSACSLRNCSKMVGVTGALAAVGVDVLPAAGDERARRVEVSGEPLRGARPDTRSLRHELRRQVRDVDPSLPEPSYPRSGRHRRTSRQSRGVRVSSAADPLRERGGAADHQSAMHGAMMRSASRRCSLIPTLPSTVERKDRQDRKAIFRQERFSLRPSATFAFFRQRQRTARTNAAQPASARRVSGVRRTRCLRVMSTS